MLDFDMWVLALAWTRESLNMSSHEIARLLRAGCGWRYKSPRFFHRPLFTLIFSEIKHIFVEHTMFLCRLPNLNVKIIAAASNVFPSSASKTVPASEHEFSSATPTLHQSIRQDVLMEPI